MQNHIVDEDKIKEDEAKSKEIEDAKKLDEKYIDYYAQFNTFLEKYEKSPLKFEMNLS